MTLNTLTECLRILFNYDHLLGNIIDQQAYSLMTFKLQLHQNKSTPTEQIHSEFKDAFHMLLKVTLRF